jgi:hypothetical protein
VTVAGIELKQTFERNHLSSFGLRKVRDGRYDGAISVFQEDDPAHFRKLGDVPMQKKAHSQHSFRVSVGIVFRLGAGFKRNKWQPKPSAQSSFERTLRTVAMVKR